MNLACIFGLGVNVFSLHVVQAKECYFIFRRCSHDAVACSFPHDSSGSHLTATRIQPQSQVVNDPAPHSRCSFCASGYFLMLIPPMISIDDMHVCYAYAHTGVLHETAGQLEITLEEKLLPCVECFCVGGCTMAEEKRKPIARTTFSRSERPLQKVFLDLSGPKAYRVRRRLTVHHAGQRRLLALRLDVLVQVQVTSYCGIPPFPCGCTR